MIRCKCVTNGIPKQDCNICIGLGHVEERHEDCDCDKIDFCESCKDKNWIDYDKYFGPAEYKL